MSASGHRAKHWVLAAALAGSTSAFLSAFQRPARQWLHQAIYDRRLHSADLVTAGAQLEYRNVEPRLSIGLPYRRLRRATRGANPRSRMDHRRVLDSAAGSLFQTRSENANASVLQGRGLAQLLMEDQGAAITTLEHAARVETAESSTRAAMAALSNAALLSDLAAAYYEAGRREGRTTALLTSIEFASRARALAPEFPAAAFNRALSIEAIHDPDQAIAAWQEDLAVERNDEWALEAREHIRNLKHLAQVKPSQDLTPEVLSERIETETLGHWGEAFESRNDDKAETALREAETLAAQLRTCCGKEIYTEAIGRIREALKNDRQRARALAIAHRQYRDGRQRLESGHAGESLPLFQASSGVFRDQQNVFAVRPWRYVAAADMYLDSSAQSEREILAAISFCNQHQCAPPALAHLQWIQGFAAGRAGDFEKAVNIYSIALRGFEVGKQRENAGSIHARIAENLAVLGLTDAVWPHVLDSLESARENGTHYRIDLSYGAAAEAAQRGGFPTSARLFQDVIVNAALRKGDPRAISDALLWRARIPNRNRADVQRDLDTSEKQAGRVADPELRARLMANIAVARSHFENTTGTVQSLIAAIAFFERSDDHYWLAELYAARGDAHEQLGHSEQADADYSRSIREMESIRGVIPDAAVRSRYFSQGSSVFDRLIRHLWTEGRKVDAFVVAEQSRGRELNGGAKIPRVAIHDISALLRADEVLVEYAVLQDRLVIWIIRPSGLGMIETRTTAAAIERAVEAMREMQSRGEDFDATMIPLAKLVYAPVVAEIGGSGRLIVVANKTLRAVPFAAFRDPVSRRYVIEEREIETAPSAASWARAKQRDRLLRAQREQPVCLAAYLEANAERQLPRLEQGRREIDALRSLYGSSANTLQGSEASPTEVLRAIERASVVHIAAHAVQNEQRPELSAIILAPRPGGSDLTAARIAATSLTRTRFVFLSSCGSSSRALQNDPPLSLAESFVAAGVSIVVASLRDVDDGPTAQFAVALHREFAATGDAAAALRHAQLHCIASSSCHDPRFWSSWIAMGGAA